ncbi:MAG: hypothetical protein WC184_04600 [Acidimicrobiia bacterium]
MSGPDPSPQSSHPNDEALSLWLETERPGRVGQHLLRCEVCLDRLDHLSKLDVAATNALSQARSQPETAIIADQGQLRNRIANQEALSGFLELFALPWSMLDVILNTSNDGNIEGEQ